MLWIVFLVVLVLFFVIEHPRMIKTDTGMYWLVFVLGMVIGVVLFLSSTLLVADHDFPNASQLDVVTMVPVTSIERNAITVNEKDKEPLFASFREWNAKRRAPAYFVTIQKQVYRLYDGVPGTILQNYQSEHNYPTILVYSDGYQPLSSLHCAPMRSVLKTGIVPGILVSVGYPCDLWWRYRQFNYCQAQDVKTLRLSIESVLGSVKEDKTQLVVCGGSKGGLTTLHFLASLQEEQPKRNETREILARIRHALVFCPITDFQTSTHGLGFAGACLRFWCPRLMPNYKTKPKALTDITSFPNIPLFVSSLRKDNFVAYESIQKALQHFVTIGPIGKENITHFISDEPLQHGQIGKDKLHGKALSEFCQI
jgi:hypothetical protein